MRADAEARHGYPYVWLISGTAVLVLDIGASLVSGRWGLGYAALRPVAIILYFCAGVGGGRLAGSWRALWPAR